MKPSQFFGFIGYLIFNVAIGVGFTWLNINDEYKHWTLLSMGYISLIVLGMIIFTMALFAVDWKKKE